MSKKTKCAHAETRLVRTSAYTGPVAVHPYTREDRRAHGGVCHRVECVACGKRRSENGNGRFTEVSPWGPRRETEPS